MTERRVGSGATADFDVCAVGARTFLGAILRQSPNGERVLVQYHPNGDWTVFDNLRYGRLLTAGEAETKLFDAISNSPDASPALIVAELNKLGFSLAANPPLQSDGADAG